MSEKRANVKRASVNRRRPAPGVREEPGDGVGDGDGGSGKDKSDSGFVFGQIDNRKKAGTETAGASNVNLQSDPSRLSYRDKLLAPGCVGFLMKHNEEDDIVRGWKNYFHQMNEKDAVKETD
ncbi:hypothetical protein QN277_020306 [Acacia crassicarpa]|uniref:Uncharacterized protein n=1 Tax=Acacia crassicarpa TaxID=499986 RepID=A0AAE1MRZ9_9FABA|nr:hypothetical protein QN277_020306 [Acacia crassicarpa]